MQDNSSKKTWGNKNWWQLCKKPKFSLTISSHHKNFHQNRATGLDFLLHTADASWLFFKCQYRGDPDFQSRSLLKTEQSLPQDLPPHKISGKLVVRQKKFYSIRNSHRQTDRPQTDRQTDHRQLIGSGLGSRRTQNFYIASCNSCAGVTGFMSF